MQERDPHVLAAMDGNDTVTETSSGTTPRKDPTALFFVIFGLVYQALVTASHDSDNSVSGRKLPVIALKCLKNLVAPEYSGEALFDPSIFDELIGLFYRIAAAESALVRIHMLDTVSALVVTQNKKFAELDAVATSVTHLHESNRG